MNINWALSRWHAGRTVKRTLYCGEGMNALIGMMDHHSMADHIVELHNQSLEVKDSKKDLSLLQEELDQARAVYAEVRKEAERLEVDRGNLIEDIRILRLEVITAKQERDKCLAERNEAERKLRVIEQVLKEF